jgi:hypothetical protein
MTTKKNYKSQKNNPAEKKKESPSSKKSFFTEINLSANQLSIFTRITFFLFSFWFLGVYNAEVLYKLQAYSLFLYNPVFTGDTLNQSAGFLIYVSRFLTQFLYYPILGALLLSLGLSGIEWGISRLFNIPSRYFFLSFIPPGLILLVQTSIGYALYHRFEASVVFSLVVGALLVLGLVAFWRKMMNLRALMALKSLRIWGALLVFFGFFFLIGVYALVALMVVLIERVVNKERYAVPLLAGGLLIGAFLPFVAAEYLFDETYIAGLISPLPDPFYKGLFGFSFLAQVFFLLYPFLKVLKDLKDFKDFKEKKVLNKAMGINILAFFLSLFAIFYFSFRDNNFRLELRLQRMTEKYKWDEIIKEAEKAQEPTETIAAYRAIALAHTDQLSQRLFDFHCQYKPPASVYMNKGLQKLCYYPDLYFHASFINVACFWNMELWTDMGDNFYLLKQMALCAMLNGEKELAAKYFNLLKQSLFYKKWAENRERYNNDPDMLMRHPVYGQIKHYMPEDDFVVPIKFSLPTYYLFLKKSFSNNVERCILASLYTKNLKQFMQIMQSAQSGVELPACIQEGLIIYAMLNDNPAVLEGFKIDRKLAEKVIHCVTECQKHGDNRKSAEEKLRKDYKGTYCYFYFFTELN